MIFSWYMLYIFSHTTLDHSQFLEQLNKPVPMQTALKDNRGGSLIFSTWAQFMLTGNSKHYFNIFFETIIIIVYTIFLCFAIWIPNRRVIFERFTSYFAILSIVEYKNRLNMRQTRANLIVSDAWLIILNQR